MLRRRIRIRFRKIDDVRQISHLDLIRTMERLFRRAGLQLGMSEGFHPKPRMSFPSALNVGQNSDVSGSFTTASGPFTRKGDVVSGRVTV